MAKEDTYLRCPPYFHCLRVNYSKSISKTVIKLVTSPNWVGDAAWEGGLCRFVIYPGSLTLRD